MSVATHAPKRDEREVEKSLLSRALTNQQVLLFGVLAAMVVFFTVRNSIFFSTGVAANVLLDWGPIVLLAVGETFVVISGGIDLSVGAAAGFAGVMGAFAMKDLTSAGHGQTFTLLVGTLVCMAAGGVVGLVNTFLINVAKLVPFVATLATLGAASGLTIVITKGSPVAEGPPNIIPLTNSWLGPFSKPVLLVVVLVVICGLFLHLARFGRYTFAIGSNAFAARAAGINVKRHLAKVYVLSGVLAGLAGMFYYIRFGSGAPSSGKGNELDAIAAVVIGGVSLAGGVGRLTGVVLGALITTTLKSGLIIINVAANWTQVAVAILIALAVSTQTLLGSGRKS